MTTLVLGFRERSVARGPATGDPCMRFYPARSPSNDHVDSTKIERVHPKEPQPSLPQERIHRWLSLGPIISFLLPLAFLVTT